MGLIRNAVRIGMIAAFAALGGGAAMAQDTLNLVTGRGACASPPPMKCPDTGCPAAQVVHPGQVVEMKTRRTYFLDYPCDLKPGEKVTFVLNLHGAGSWGNWQRHYFPAFDYVGKHRMIVATPNAPTGTWTATDDPYLQNIVDYVVGRVGKENVKSFWLAGHSQGGLTSRRIVCTDYFKDKVDGFLSLSGGRLGEQSVGGTPQAGRGGPPGAPPAAGRGGPPAAPPAAGRGGIASQALPACDFNYIYTVGALEMAGGTGKMPPTSPWAEKYGCAAKVRRAVLDTKGGYVTGTSTGGTAGRLGPGTAELDLFPNCRGGMVVADVARLNKGHTNGLEPVVTEEMVKLMAAAPGGKIQRGSWTPPPVEIPAGRGGPPGAGRGGAGRGGPPPAGRGA